MSPVQLYLHTYSLRFHLAHQPGFDVFAFIERVAAEGFVGICLSANDAHQRSLVWLKQALTTAGIDLAQP